MPVGRAAPVAGEAHEVLPEVRRHLVVAPHRAAAAPVRKRAVEDVQRRVVCTIPWENQSKLALLFGAYASWDHNWFRRESLSTFSHLTTYVGSAGLYDKSPATKASRLDKVDSR